MGHKFILVVADEVTNCDIAIPLHSYKSTEVGEAIVNHVICKYGATDFLIFYEDAAFF